MRLSAMILFAAAGCTFDASGLGETPQTGGGPGTSASTTIGSVGGSSGPTTTVEETLGVSGSGSMTDGSGGPGGDPTTSPGTATTTTTGPDTTTGDVTTTLPMTTTEPCEMVLLYADTDNDGYGDPNSPAMVCVGTQSYVPDNTDCNDMSANAHPGFGELCDTIDNDCDGKLDEYEKPGNTDSCGGCSFKIHDKNLYYFCGWGANWDTAQGFCVSHGLNLVKDDGGGEHDWLLQQIGDTGLWWIGANDKGSEGDFKWVSDNSDVPSPGEWATGEPNDQEWFGWENCDCAALLDSNGELGYPGQGAKWNDHECGDGQHFICEGPEP